MQLTLNRCRANCN